MKLEVLSVDRLDRSTNEVHFTVKRAYEPGEKWPPMHGKIKLNMAIIIEDFLNEDTVGLNDQLITWFDKDGRVIE